MNYLRSGIRNLVGQNGSPSYGTSEGAETVERLVDRVRTATLLEDRRDALRALKSLSKRFRLEVGTQAMDTLLDVLRNSTSSTEIVSYALESLSNVIGGDAEEEEHEYSEAEAQDLGERFTEIFIKKRENLELVLSFIENYEFTIRLHAVRLLTGLLRHRPKDLQEHLLLTPGAIPKITDLLAENREVVRNDAVLLVYELVRGNANIQKIVAFESAFERLLDIVANEHDSIVAEDCLYVTIQLLKNNSSNQQLFRENSLVPRLPLLLRLLSGNTADIFDDDHPHSELDDSGRQGEIQWTAQRVSNIHLLFQVTRALVSPTSAGGNLTSAAQKAMNACGLLGELCHLLLSGGVPADVLTETINTVAEIIRGYQPNQEYFGALVAPSDPPRSATLVLIMSMANERQPFSMRLAALYCVQCYLFNNEKGKREIIQTLLPSSSEGTDITAGHLICSGLISSDPLVVWFSCCILMHCVLDASQADKERLLRVQMATGVGNPPVSLLQQVGAVLTQARDLQVRIGVLMLLSAWLTDSSASVAQFLQHSAHVPYLTSQACMTEGDEMEALAYGMCAFVLGICLFYNDDSVQKFNRRELQQLLENRITRGVFIDQLSTVSKSEPYARAAQKPQPKSKQPPELLFDHEFTKLFRHLESELSRIVRSSDAHGRGGSGLGGGRFGDTAGGRRSKESTPMAGTEAHADDHDQSILNGDLLSALPPQTAEQHLTVMQQYKDLIKRQDAEMVALKQRIKDLESQGIAAAASSIDIRRKEDDFENRIADLQHQLAEKCKLLDEEKMKQTTHSATIGQVSYGVAQNSQLNAIIERQQLEVNRLTAENARLAAEMEQMKAVCTEHQSELASWRQHCTQWRAYYESQVTPDTQQIVAGLEAQLKDVESQLAYGWQAFEAQGQQLVSVTSQLEQSKQQADYNLQWSNYWRAECEKLTSTIAAKEASKTEIPVQQYENIENDGDRAALMEELTNLRKEQEDLLVLCADQDQKLKEYRKIMKERGLLSAAEASDDEDEEGDVEEVEREERIQERPVVVNNDDSGTLYHASRLWNQQQLHQNQQPPVGYSHSGARTLGDGQDYYDLR